MKKEKKNDRIKIALHPINNLKKTTYFTLYIDA